MSEQEIDEATILRRAKWNAKATKWRKTESGQASLKKTYKAKYVKEKAAREADPVRMAEYEAAQLAHRHSEHGKILAGERHKKYKEKNPEAYAASVAKYYASEKGQIYKWSNQASMRIRGLEEIAGSFVSAAYLRDLWYQQKGICALSGDKMEPRPKGKSTLYSCTVDRFDQTKGYIPGNVRLVTFQANAARHFGSDEMLEQLCQDILRHHNMALDDEYQPTAPLLAAD